MEGNEHPVVRWVTVGTLITGAIGIVVGTWLYLEAVRSDMQNLREQVEQVAEAERVRDAGWLVEESEEHDELRTILNNTMSIQEAGQTELARQSLWLNDLSTAFSNSFTQREQRFEELENEHKLLLAAIAESQYRLGIHQGAHRQLETLIGDVKRLLEQQRQED